MDNLGILEEKVGAAIKALAKLRAESSALAERLKKAEGEVKRLQQELDKSQAGLAGMKKNEEEIGTLRSEREAVRSRIGSMLERLAVLDEEGD